MKTGHCLAAAAAAVLALTAGCSRPAAPTVPEFGGPGSGQPAETLAFWAVSRDRNRDNLSYRFDWDDGSPQFWTAELAAGETTMQRHCFADTGRYAVRVMARDESGMESGWAEALQLQVGFSGPVTPERPDGPAAAWPDTVLGFLTRAGHVRAESVSVQFDWGDSTGDWGGFVPAGTVVRDSHSYGARGVFEVRARARDRSGGVSPWSAPETVRVGHAPLGPPLDLSLSASAGTQVKLRWNASRHDDSVDYRIWFRHLDSSRFRCVDSADHTSYVHEPLAQTGDYTVSARLDSAEEFAADTLSTIPVATDTIVLPELNRDSLAGYGWDASTRLGRRRTMRDSLRAGEAAFYFTDFAPGWSGPFYYLASPDLGPQDPGGVVPAGPWPSTGFFPLWGSNQDPLPEYDSLLYQDAVDIGSVRTDVAVHVADGYYALVATLGPDTGTGSVRVLSWCQAVRGLRLIRHYEDTLTRRVR